MFHPLIAVQQAFALIWRHGIELSEEIAEMLLCLWRQVAETIQIFERFLLLIERQVAVSTHPLIQVYALSF